MIRVLRNIRKTLAAENKAAAYLRYAIGEIILVMIGILLALQVNSWNRSRLNRIEEKNILATLHNEFLENKKMLDSTTAIYTGAMNANITIMNLIGKSAEELEKYDLDSLFYASLPSSQIVFSNSTVENIVQTGKLDIIEDPEIIQLINQWEATTVMIKEREKSLGDWINNHLLPIINDYVAFKEIDHNGNLPWTGKSALTPDYYTLFHLLKYENIQDNVLWYHHKNLNGLKIANEVIIKIINATEPHKNNKTFNND